MTFEKKILSCSFSKRSPNDESFGVGLKRGCVVCFNFLFCKPSLRFKGFAGSLSVAVFYMDRRDEGQSYLACVFSPSLREHG